MLVHAEAPDVLDPPPTRKQSLGQQIASCMIKVRVKNTPSKTDALTNWLMIERVDNLIFNFQNNKYCKKIQKLFFKF